ncbi:ABC transporter permease [Larkinella sp. C7]|jgi:putative ABC transport system permease protein|uniref:ABC transporter permease n=1 Tax=Larkinella sp. C7 TaxID=2576607 RepID=UPI001E56AFF7|nr:ABC transporter permease [Larkinella sp. C7]
MKPPQLADRLLEFFCAPHRLEEVQGDLHEEFQYQLRRVGKQRARRWYWWGVLGFLKPPAGWPFDIKRKKTDDSTTHLMNPTMISNYFKIARRNLVRNKAFSAINILGLALGMACSLLILLWVQDERSVDGFHANGDRLFQIYERGFYDGKVEASYYTQGLLAEELKRVVPEVERASGLEQSRTATFEAAGKINKADGSFAGADFFSMFSYPLVQGTPETALNTPEGIAISRKMAELFFGKPEQAVGQTIRYENRDDLMVTAVFENLPANSSQHFDFLRSWKAYVKENQWVHNWSNTSPLTFVQLRPGADPAKVEAKIKEFIYQYTTKTAGSHTELALQPYPEKYLNATFKNGQVDGGRIDYVRLFSVVAVFILLIACINFMNLATARSTKRAKEVGVRKVVGAVRSALIGQFMGEAILLTFVAVVLAVMLVLILLPAFNELTGKRLFLPFGQPVFWASLVGLLLLTGLVSGSYPALFLSSMNPILALKGRMLSARLGFGATFFRKSLVVFQFSLSMILIVGMIVIYRQMGYIQSKNIGYDRENLLYIPIEGDLVQKYNLFKDEAEKQPGILTISRMKESPTLIGHHRSDIEWVGKDPGLLVPFADAVVGFDFLKTMNLKLAEGRDFSREFGTDSASYLVNEAAVRKIGYKNPIGKSMWWGNREGKIIGVLKDFHFNSMHQAIEPLIVRLDEQQKWGSILVRAEAGKTREALASLEKICKELNPNFPFTYQFSDLEYAKLYHSEQVVSQLANAFAFLAIFISCLGLFGLAAFMAEQRTKEIGVRKVLGASVPNIVVLLSANFLKPVAIAMLIAFPIAWYAMNRWLQGFAYQVDLAWWVFAVAGLLTVVIALLTVSFQSVKAALMNPVKSLKSE